MKYEHARALPAAAFRRRTGVHKHTFATMVESLPRTRSGVVRKAELARKKTSGRPAKLAIEDQLLMTLEYLREYRTYFHVAHDYGVSESTCFKIIRKCEDMLIASRQFALPKRRRVLVDGGIEVVVVDCTESPIERPKKNSEDTTRERKNGTRSRRRS